MKADDVGVLLGLINNRVKKLKQGPKGDAGASIKGDRGNDGADGKDGVSVHSVKDSPLSRYFVINLDNGQSFKIKKPRNGRDGKARHGKDGTDGVGIKALSVNAEGRLLATLTDGVQLRTNPIPIPEPIAGKDGDDGTRNISGYGVPLSHIGQPSDWYLDRRDGSWWEKVGDVWELRYKYPKAGVSGGLSEQSVREIIARVNPFSGYHLNDEDSIGLVKYYGYTREIQEDGDHFYILRIDDTLPEITLRYSVDGADYDAAWTNRASLTYKRLNEVDIK